MSMSPEMMERLVYIVFIIVLLIVERWLGVTNKVKAASILESVQNVILKKVLDEPAPNEEKKE